MTLTSSTVRKALGLMDHFVGKPDGLTLSQLSALAGLNKATALRLCATLESAGFLEREAMVYRVGRKVWQLAQVYRQQFRLEDIVRPALRRLRDETGESASFYIREGDERVCLVRENSRQTIRHHLEEGARLPLAKGVVGRVLLAFSGEPGAELERIRTDGHLMAQGREPHTASVAAPVLDAAGALVGGIVVSGPHSRFGADRQRAALDLVLAVCTALRERLPTPASKGPSHESEIPARVAARPRAAGSRRQTARA